MTKVTGDLSIYTIGHSTHPIEKFLSLLRLHAITAVADVRSKPYSKMNPQFDRDELRTTLKANGMHYVFMGKELGARSDDRNDYLNGRVQYDRLASKEAFKASIRRICDGAMSNRIVLMCAEKDPIQCHRTVLVSRALVDSELQVIHILGDGRTETHEQAMARVVETLRVKPADMFRDQSQVLSDAYRQQAEVIAYQDERMKTEPTDA